MIFLFLLPNFQHGLLIWCLLWNRGLFADPYRWGSVLHSLATRGMIVWIYHTVSLSPVRIAPMTHFQYFQKLALQHVFKKEVDESAEKAALFFSACQPNPVTKVKVTEAMRMSGYTNPESANLMLQMQVHRAI